MESRRQEWLYLHGCIDVILARHGRNEIGGDYYLEPKDLGACDIKVLVFFSDTLNADLLQEVFSTLLECSLKWRVLFVEAARDGTELFPPSGLVVSSSGPASLAPQRTSGEETNETKALYEALEELLSKHGRSDAFGSGDYWIVDDNWVPLSHMVCIFNLGFFTPDLAVEIQRLLKTKFPACVVWFQIEILEPNVKIPLPGVRVFSDHIEQDWSVDEMRSLFKDRFKW